MLPFAGGGGSGRGRHPASSFGSQPLPSSSTKGEGSASLVGVALGTSGVRAGSGPGEGRGRGVMLPWAGASGLGRRSEPPSRAAGCWGGDGGRLSLQGWRWRVRIWATSRHVLRSLSPLSLPNKGEGSAGWARLDLGPGGMAGQREWGGRVGAPYRRCPRGRGGGGRLGGCGAMGFRRSPAAGGGGAAPRPRLALSRPLVPPTLSLPTGGEGSADWVGVAPGTGRGEAWGCPGDARGITGAALGFEARAGSGGQGGAVLPAPVTACFRTSGRRRRRRVPRG